MERVEDTVPYGDRSDMVIEPWPTDQRFVERAPEDVVEEQKARREEARARRERPPRALGNLAA